MNRWEGSRVKNYETTYVCMYLVKGIMDLFTGSYREYCSESRKYLKVKVPRMPTSRLGGGEGLYFVSVL